MTEEDLVNFLKRHLKLEIEEHASPYLPANQKKLEIKLVLARPENDVVISSKFLTIFEGR